MLDRLQQTHPSFSRLYQERGHCHVLLRDAAQAIDALQQAVRLNPTLPASWDMLEQLHRMRGDAAQASDSCSLVHMSRGAVWLDNRSHAGLHAVGWHFLFPTQRRVGTGCAFKPHRSAARWPALVALVSKPWMMRCCCRG